MTTFYDVIYNWVAENFGESEADDPSWDIKALSSHLSEQDINPDELNAYTKLECYRTVEQAYLREDCETVAEGMGVDLTERQKDVVVDEFMNSEAYLDAHAEDWEWFIKQELKHGEEK